MSTPTFLLGVDVSTTATKALLVDEKGTVVASASTPHSLSTPLPLWSEQNPEEWWQATSASIRLVLLQAGLGGEAVAAVGLTGQMHGLVLLDELWGKCCVPPSFGTISAPANSARISESGWAKAN